MRGPLPLVPGPFSLSKIPADIFGSLSLRVSPFSQQADLFCSIPFSAYLSWHAQTGLIHLGFGSVTSASLADFFGSRGTFTHNMRTSFPCTRTVATHQVDFFGRNTHTHTDLINGPLSKRASGPFAEVRANVLSFFPCERFPSRALRALCSQTFFSTSKVGA